MGSGRELGILRVNMTYLARRWFKTRIRTRDVAEVGIVSDTKNVVEGFKMMLEKWDSPSAVNELLRELPDFPNNLIQKLTQNSQILENSVTAGSFHGLEDLGNLWATIHGRRFTGRLVFERERALVEELGELSQQRKRYNIAGSIVSKAGKNAKPGQIDAVNRERRLMKERIEHVLSNLTMVRDRLFDEMQSTVC